MDRRPVGLATCRTRFSGEQTARPSTAAAQSTRERCAWTGVNADDLDVYQDSPATARVGAGVCGGRGPQATLPASLLSAGVCGVSAAGLKMQPIKTQNSIAKNGASQERV